MIPSYLTQDIFYAWSKNNFQETCISFIDEKYWKYTENDLWEILQIFFDLIDLYIQTLKKFEKRWFYFISNIEKQEFLQLKREIFYLENIIDKFASGENEKIVLKKWFSFTYSQKECSFLTEDKISEKSKDNELYSFATDLDKLYLWLMYEKKVIDTRYWYWEIKYKTNFNIIKNIENVKPDIYLFFICNITDINPKINDILKSDFGLNSFSFEKNIFDNFHQQIDENLSKKIIDLIKYLSEYNKNQENNIFNRYSFDLVVFDKLFKKLDKDTVIESNFIEKVIEKNDFSKDVLDFLKNIWYEKEFIEKIVKDEKLDKNLIDFIKKCDKQNFEKYNSLSFDFSKIDKKTYLQNMFFEDFRELLWKNIFWLWDIAENISQNFLNNKYIFNENISLKNFLDFYNNLEAQVSNRKWYLYEYTIYNLFDFLSENKDVTIWFFKDLFLSENKYIFEFIFNREGYNIFWTSKHWLKNKKDKNLEIVTLNKIIKILSSIYWLEEFKTTDFIEKNKINLINKSIKDEDLKVFLFSYNHLDKFWKEDLNIFYENIIKKLLDEYSKSYYDDDKNFIKNVILTLVSNKKINFSLIEGYILELIKKEEKFIWKNRNKLSNLVLFLLQNQENNDKLNQLLKEKIKGENKDVYKLILGFASDFKKYNLKIDFLEDKEIITDFFDYIINIFNWRLGNHFINLLYTLNQKTKEILRKYINEDIEKYKNKRLVFVNEILEVLTTKVIIENEKNEESKDINKSTKTIQDFLYPKNTFISQETHNFIAKQKSGSCLFTWYRWVWKTSLIKQTISKLNDIYRLNWENKSLIPVIINIPDIKRTTWENYSKQEILNLIIRGLYLEIRSIPNIPKNILHNFEEQYIKTFKQVEEVNWYLKITKRFWVLWTILSVTTSSTPFFFSLWIFILLWFNIYTWIEFIDSIIEFVKIQNWWFLNIIIAFFTSIITFLLTRNILNVNYNARLERALYNDDIIENNLSSNLKDINYRFDFFISFNDFKNKLLDFLFLDLRNFIQKSRDEVKRLDYTYSIIPFLILLIFFIFISTKSYYILIILWILLIYMTIMYLYDKKNIFWISLNFLSIPWYIIDYFIRNKTDYKVVFVIDELDKILSIEKSHTKQIDAMEKIFDVLWKLKILFFDTKNSLFFIVSNKTSYDFYLQNKSQEDDVISNIFTKVLYFPMKYRKNYTLNQNIILDNKEQINFNDYYYYYSHANFRKLQFNLNQEIIHTEKEIFIDFDDDKIHTLKYYDFFNLLDQILENKSFDIKNSDFDSYKFIKKFKKFFSFDEKDNILEKMQLSQHQFAYIYINLLESIKNIKIELEDNKRHEDIDSQINFILNEFKILSKKNEYDIWVYIFESIEKLVGFSKETTILKQYDAIVYRDTILNLLLNTMENIRTYRKIEISRLIDKLNLWYEDIIYWAFREFVIVWLPLMLYYYENKKIDSLWFNK